MKELVKEVAEVVVNSPKLSVTVTGFVNWAAWADWGMPIVQAITSIFGMFVVIFLAIKHGSDVGKLWKDRKKESAEETDT